MNQTELPSYREFQKYLGKKGLIAYIVLMNMFIPLSTDLYLPSLPTMNTYFGSSSAITNLTLSAFFICYAVGILFWGPMSDKYGRKPIILIGSTLYIVSSIACALSTNIYFLVFARIFQGIGSGGITASSVAMVKDCYSGKKREGVLAVVQTLAGLAPMLAPVLGAILLKVVNWQGTFWTLAGIGILNLTLTILYQETLQKEDRFTGTLIGSMGRLIHVSRNKSFIIPVLIFSLVSIPFMGYIAVSSYIYVEYFGLSEQDYSYFFAFNALISLLGPTIYIKFLRNVDKKLFSSLCFGIAAIGGVIMMTAGRLSPFFFLFSTVIMSLSCTMLRPFSTNLLFNQQQGDTGSASSIISTTWMVLGSVGMSLASLPWGDGILGLAVLVTALSSASLAAWWWFNQSDIPCVGLKDYT
ncbi:multidrug effflux MFS transporter [Anoxybacterium hadale]|uniref:Multidrug effflux MFS transporter n=1 Tax=Anoxybacterium hadale TaxID=3408580 RepID=A0ACD1AHF5_9FIRM|nr:multidrug effflux MFS transporter [Clostridiales bacterium]